MIDNKGDSMLEELFSDIRSEDNQLDFLNNSIFFTEEEKPIPPIEHDKPVKSEKTRESPKAKKVYKRGKKADDFDYNEYIEKEMANIDTEDLTDAQKKNLMAKIRNRVSAQRSRMRSKNQLERLRSENLQLKTNNNELFKAITVLKTENDNLRNEVEKLQHSLKSQSTSENDTNKDTSFDFFRSNPKPGNTGDSSFRSFLFIAIMVIAVAYSPNIDNGSGSPSFNSQIRMGGVVPMLATNIPGSDKQLRTLENICKPYCDANHKCKDMNELYDELRLKRADEGTGLVKYEEQTDKVLHGMMCYDGEAENSTNGKIILFDDTTMNKLRGEADAYYVPRVVNINEKIMVK